MLLTHALDLEVVGYLLQPAFERLAALHQVLDVVHHGEVQLEKLEKLGLGRREILSDENPQKVPKVVSAKEGTGGGGGGREEEEECVCVCVCECACACVWESDGVNHQ